MVLWFMWFIQERLKRIEKKESGAIALTGLLICLQILVSNRFSDIKSEWSFWQEQATTPLQGYTDPYTGGISAPSVMMADDVIAGICAR